MLPQFLNTTLLRKLLGRPNTASPFSHVMFGHRLATMAQQGLCFRKVGTFFFVRPRFCTKVTELKFRFRDPCGLASTIEPETQCRSS